MVEIITECAVINQTMELMGILQTELPSTVAISLHFSLKVFDLKDCLFTVFLHIQDKKYFTFSLPTIMCDYQWHCLP